MAAVALGELLMAARRMPDGPEKQRSILKVVRALVRLRKTEREHEKELRAAAQDKRMQEVHQHWADDARRRRAQAEEMAAARAAEPKQVWWTEEDQALEGDDDWDEEQKAEDGGRKADEADAGPAEAGKSDEADGASMSTITSMSTRVSVRMGAEEVAPSGTGEITGNHSKS
jgi:hypothetical protein